MNNSNRSIRKTQTGHFPGKAKIEQGLALLADLLEQANSFNLIERCLEQATRLEDFAENFEIWTIFTTASSKLGKHFSKAFATSSRPNRPFLEKDSSAKKSIG